MLLHCRPEHHEVQRFERKIAENTGLGGQRRVEFPVAGDLLQQAENVGQDLLA
jgi:hypothetical protein